MTDGEGGGAGGCRERFSDDGEGVSSDQHIHHDSRRFPKHGTLFHQEDGAYHIKRLHRSPFRFEETLP